MSSWTCLHPDCDAGGTGTHDEVQRAAARHTEKPPKHATSTRWTDQPDAPQGDR